MKKRNLTTTLILGCLFITIAFTSCKKETAVNPNSTQNVNPISAAGSGTRGISSAIPAYYDAKLFKILFVEFSSNAEKTLIAHNGGLNFIYQYDPGVNGEPFISVIDAIPGDGMNPIWEEVQITFLTIAPQQFLSDNDVLAARDAGQISLTNTGEVYWCPIVGHK